MLAGAWLAVAAMLELTERRVIERIVFKALDAGDGANLVEPAFGPFTLRDGNGSIERHNWGGPKGHQRIVQPDNLPPIRVFGARRVRMNGGDCGLDVIFGDLRPGRGLIQQAQSFLHEP